MNLSDAKPDSESRGGGFTETLHIFALSSIALAQPLFDVYGRHASSSSRAGQSRVDVMLLVLAVSALIPLAVVLSLAGLRRVVPGVFPAARSAALATLGTMALLPVAKRLPSASPIVMLGIALGGGLLLAVGSSRYRFIRQFLTALSPAIVVVPLVFLLATPVARIVLPRELRVSIPGTPQANHPVVFVVLDCLPTAVLVGEEGDIDAVRFPNIARLAQTAHWFRQARTVAINTSGALPSLLTGRYREKGTLPIAEHHPENLFTLQRWRGGMTVLESLSQLCPKSLQERREVEPLMTRLRTLGRDSAVVYGHVVLPGKTSTWLPPVDDQWGGFGAPVERPGAPRSWKALRMKVRRATVRAVQGDSVARFEEFLSGLQHDGLSYLHLNLPHSPYLYLPSGKTYVPRGRLNRSLRLQRAFGKVKDAKVGRWTAQEYPVRLAYQRHVLQAAFADRLLGRLLDRMVEVGMFDRSMVILVSDHGESFRPGEPRRTLEDGGTLHVPLLIKQPFQRSPEISDRPVTLVDVLPTISDALDIEVPWRMDGTSLLRNDDEDGNEASTGWPEDLLSSDVRRSHDWVGFGDTTESTK